MSKIMSADIFRSLTNDIDIAALGEELYATDGIVACDGAGTLSASPGVGGFDTSALHLDTAAEVSALTAKTAPVGADVLLIEDSQEETAYSKKKLTLTALASMMAIVPDNAAEASSANEGSLRYHKGEGSCSLDISMQTDTAAWSWVSIVSYTY